MREQFKLRLEKQAKDEKTRQGIVAKLQETIGPRREKVSELLLMEPAMDPDGEVLREEVRGDLDSANRKRWPWIVAGKADAIADAADDLEKEAGVLERILAGYRRQFGFEIEPKEGEGEGGEA